MPRLRRSMWIIAGMMLAGWSFTNPHAAEKKVAKKPQRVVRELVWQTLGIHDARKAEKPILLYLFDAHDNRLGPVSKEQRMLNNTAVKEAFERFTLVKQPASTTAWPAELTAHATKGPALLVMTCDAKPVTVLDGLPEPAKDKSGNESYPTLCAAAAAALKANLEARAARLKAEEPAAESISSLMDSKQEARNVAKKSATETPRNGSAEPANEDE